MGVCWNNSRIAVRGAFGNGRNRVHSAASITDGLSNTMLYAEGIIALENSRQVTTGTAMFPQRVRMWDDRHNFRPADWMTARGPNNMIAQGIEEYRGGENIGWRYGDGRAPFTVVYNILPPNSPNIRYFEEMHMASVSSFHPGGAGTIAADSSYRFVTNSVNTANQGIQRRSGVTGWGLDLGWPDLAAIGNPDSEGDIMSYNGPSPYGIWGAYATVSSGDPAPTL